MASIKITPRRVSRKTAPPPIETTNEQVVRPGNSGSTIGSPPQRDDGSPEEHARRALALSVARKGLPGKMPDRQPFMFHNPNNILCYRNSILAMLLNIEPFVGWLHLNYGVSSAGKECYPHSIPSYLYQVAEAYWLSADPSPRALEAATDPIILADFWGDLNGRWQWRGPSTQEDPSEFLDHMWSQARGEIDNE